MSILKEYMNDLEFIDAAIFSEILHNSLGFLNDFSIKRVFYAADVHKNRRITREDFIRVLSVMLRGTLKEKIKLCFTCFDISDNLELTREDVIFLLLEAVSEPPTKDATTDALRDLVEMIFTKMDEDGDGVITIEEFEKVCIKDWTLMEMFGECLPDYRVSSFAFEDVCSHVKYEFIGFVVYH
ncbi:EF-hand calcium-binding domain-containing protein 1 [Caerostris darwini]|uniref:EF-hand calcium-binding domain-containing protein 1 n=1 Tax=Caerostris darwini TaxID=1538125 RepID=A0AAV4VAE7_9ARAC|nr:EF-hand calcium-binding domain-containing protein 1 [Caerostris darwini]